MYSSRSKQTRFSPFSFPQRYRDICGCNLYITAVGNLPLNEIPADTNHQHNIHKNQIHASKLVLQSLGHKKTYSISFSSCNNLDEWPVDLQPNKTKMHVPGHTVHVQPHHVQNLHRRKFHRTQMYIHMNGNVIQKKKKPTNSLFID